MATERPDKSIHLEDSDITVTMTYAVFNDILRFVGSVEEAVNAILTDQETRDIVVRRLLTDTKKSVQDASELIPVENVELDIFEIDDLLSWTVDHVTYFFMKTASGIQNRIEKYPETQKKMMTTSSAPSATGSIASET